MTTGWEKTERKLVRYPIYITWVTLVIVILIVVIDVSGRYFFNRPLPATTEMSELLLPYIIFPSLAYALAAGSHIRVTLVTDRFPERGQLWCDILAYTIGAVLLGIMTYFGWRLFWQSWVIKEEMMATIDLPWWASKFIFPVGAAIFCIQFVVQMVSTIMKLIGKNRASQEGPQ
jgi:TRAP-type C4-dicarboxylate transport system permease small subunit